MKSEFLPCVEVEPSTPPRAAVIWLHGLGADGHDFEPIVPELGLAPDLGVRFVFPHAPPIPVTINMGMTMPAWYDIQDLDLGSRVDRHGLERSAAAIRRLIEREMERGVPSRSIVLAGFSQGGSVALHVGLHHRERLAGLVALSSYMAETDELSPVPAGAGLSIFQGHGSLDPMVPLRWGEEARDRLRSLGHSVEFRTYPMAHGVSPEEIAHVGTWLGATLRQ